ncbi:MAG: hypothetical protein NVS9B12_04620 [Vulcanimicrobiaceae bacterium]
MKESSYYRRLFVRITLLIYCGLLCACSGTTSEDFDRRPITVAQTGVLVNTALSWHIPPYTHTIAGATLLHDGRPFAHQNLAVARSIERSNERLSSFDALQWAESAVHAARTSGLNPEFFAATLLQESAFDPNALSSAGAVGIAQFTLDTAQAYGVNPFDPDSAIGGSAALLARYFSAYSGKYPDPYAVTLAAYNAGPGAVAAHHGIPPYAETREYIADVYGRWARILNDERAP